jgi:hypothetical protein
MSSELERLLRDARTALPGPEESATGSARERALQAVRRQPRRSVRIAALSVTSFAIVLALGIAIGAMVTPKGQAAKDAVGLGFLPAPGWTAFQTGGEVNPVFQTVAIASNGPLDPEDQVAGAADPSGLPLATLEKLPANGVVITASFTRSTSFDGGPDSELPTRELPLRLSEATRYLQYGTQVRPEDPLGQWEIRGVVNEHVVDVFIYFGTATPSAALRADANRQLERLVVQRSGSPAREDTQLGPARPAAANKSSGAVAANVVERTLSCTTGVHAGAHVVYIGSQTGFKNGDTFQYLAQANVTTAGSQIASQPNNYQPQLVAMTAGYPPKPPLTTGGVGYDGKRCVPTKAQVPLSKRGLSGGVANAFGDQTECFPPGKVLIHFRVVFTAPPTVKVNKKARFYQALGRVKLGQMAVRSVTGKPLAYLDVVDAGTSRAFTAGSCS